MASITIKGLPTERHVERPHASKEELLAQAARLRAKLPPVDHGLVDGFKRNGRP